MDKTLIGMVAAIGAMAPLAAHADVSTTEVSASMEASSFSELLKPIPNALAILKAVDEQETVNPTPEGVQDDGVMMAQYHHHHHHHHHHHYYHHHHHHHHYWYHHHYY